MISNVHQSRPVGVWAYMSHVLYVCTYMSHVLYGKHTCSIDIDIRHRHNTTSSRHRHADIDTTRHGREQEQKQEQKQLVAVEAGRQAGRRAQTCSQNSMTTHSTSKQPGPTEQTPPLNTQPTTHIHIMTQEGSAMRM